jgi:hypothetical protein
MELIRRLLTLHRGYGLITEQEVQQVIEGILKDLS